MAFKSYGKIEESKFQSLIFSLLESLIHLRIFVIAEAGTNLTIESFGAYTCTAKFQR